MVEPLLPPPSVSPDQSTLPLVQLTNVTKLFPVRRRFLGRAQFVRAVENVSLYIHRGETLGLVGESGCGKSTLGRTLLRLIHPTFGQVVFDGENITELSEGAMRPMRQRMQLVFQDPASSLNPRLTVREIVAEGLQIHRLAKSRGTEQEQVRILLGRVGLPAHFDARLPTELSAGERQRVCIARALAVRPELIVWDEPLSALDVSVQAQIINLLLKLQAEANLTYLFISHDLRVVSYVSHRIAVMYLGHIVEQGPAFSVTQHRFHPYTRALYNALPVPDPKTRRLRILLEGEPPSAVSPPEGCPFHPRCPRAEPGLCDRAPPTLSELTPGGEHYVACYNPHD